MSDHVCRCGAPFVPKRAHGRFCSPACRLAAWAARKSVPHPASDAPTEALTLVSEEQCPRGDVGPEALTPREQQAIREAAAGCVSGRLSEWPVLAAAFRKHGLDVPGSVNARAAVAIARFLEGRR
jgi:hypothetical protein